jgi:hypothetical protein
LHRYTETPETVETVETVETPAEEEAKEEEDEWPDVSDDEDEAALGEWPDDDEVGLSDKLNAVDLELENAWFQPLDPEM